MPDEPPPEEALRTLLDGLPPEELRLALVLNGGVSLAVWMGGVTHEIDRLTRCAPGRRSAYGPVLAAARTTVAVDVVSGTSAGGINGAALALAQANERADLRALRTLWAEQGRMEQLLRRPFRGHPTSMLRGDEYFLPELQRAMQLLAFPFAPREPRAALDLTLTTTLLTGAQDVTTDDFGERIPERIHAGTFRFSNIGPDELVPETEDLFGQAQVEGTAQALALAARCTASFPLAFEPSFVPVNEPQPDGSRPDMGRFASWARDDPAGCHSRYAVDGGLLANTPLDHALEAITRRRVDGAVRRAMLMVFPHAPQAEEVAPDSAATPPGAAAAMGGVFGALLAQGSRSFVERVDAHNRTAAEWQGSREQVLAGMGTDDPVASLYTLLGSGWPHYRHIRIRHAARGLVDLADGHEQWSYDRIREAAEDAQRAWTRPGDRGPGRVLPYVPARFAWRDEDWQDAHLTGHEGAGPTAWPWGDSTALGVLDAVTAVLRAALSVAPAPSRQVLVRARRKVDELTAGLRASRREIDRIWTANAYLRTLLPTTDYWRARIIAYGRSMQDRSAFSDRDRDELDDLLPRVDHDPALAALRDEAIAAIGERTGGEGAAMGTAARVAVTRLANVAFQLSALADGPAGSDEVSGLRRWRDFLFRDPLEDEPGDLTQRLLLRLLALDAGTRLLSDGTSTGANLPVRLAELSLRVTHPWTRFSTTPTDKAAGLQLARFGGFLKRSWRMNDWTWGRLDAVTMLCQTVLDPQRIARMAAMLGDDRPTPEELFDLLRTDLYGDAQLPESLGPLAAAALADLRRALDTEPDCRHLPNLARWAALPLQAEVMLEELPVLAAAIKVDLEEGAGTPTRGTRFLLEQADLLRRIPTIAPLPEETVTTRERFAAGHEALRAFDAAGVGRERLGEETGSDALIRAVSSAAGVLATVVDTDVSRSAPAARPVTSVIRGALIVPYWIINGLAGSGTVGRFVASLGLVLGGLVLALSLLGVLGGLAPAAGLLGGATVLAALGYSALKTGSALHACALLAPVGPLLAFAVEAGSERDGAADDAAGRVLLLLAAIAALYVLANIPWPLASPFSVVPAATGRAWTWTRRRWRVALGLLAVAVLALVAVLTWDAWRPTDDTLDRWRDLATERWFVAVVFGGTVLVGAAAAYVQGVWLRAWRPRGVVVDGVPTAPRISYDVPGAATGSFGWERVEHPAGVAASWAPVYGAGYLLVAFALLWRGWADPAGDEVWRAASYWWFTGLGVLLCVGAPLLIGARARRRVRDALARSWPPPPFPAGDGDASWRPGEGDDAQLLIFSLLKYDKPHYFLVRAGPAAPGAVWGRLAGRPRRTSTLVLTRRGRRLLDHLQDSEARAQPFSPGR